MNQTTYIENVSSFVSNVKNSIIYESYHNTEKLVKKEEVEQSKEGTTLFIEGALLSLLENKDIVCVIEKESSNLERLLYFKSKDENKVNQYMDDFKTKGEFKSNEKYNEFYADYTSDSETLDEIKKEFESNKHSISTYSLAKCVYDKYVKDTKGLTQTVILSTASQYQFIKSISWALNLDNSLDEFDLIDMVSKKSNINILIIITEFRKNIRSNHPKTLDEAHKYLEENLLQK